MTYSSYPNFSLSRWAQKRITPITSNQASFSFNEVSLYVFDSATVIEHPEFIGCKIERLRNCVEPLTNAHSTQLLSLIVGKNLGLCAHVKVYDLPLSSNPNNLSSSFLNNVHCAIEHARSDKNKKIAFLPWLSTEKNMNVGVELLLAEGFIVSTAAGNEWQNNEFFSPTLNENVITTGATTFYNAVMFEQKIKSGFGKHTQIMAPGKYILTAHLPKNKNLDTNNYIFLNGTCCAAALTTAVLCNYLGDPRIYNLDFLSLKTRLLNDSLKDILIYPKNLQELWPNNFLQNPYSLLGADIYVDLLHKINFVSITEQTVP